MKNLIYKKFIIGTGEYLDYALENHLGGVIFFTKDIPSKEQFINLVHDIKKKAKEPLFLSIDQEGGRVERTENIHVRYLSQKFAYEKGFDYMKMQYENIANELKEYGLNLNFSPCADVNTNPLKTIIGERSFSDNVVDVIKGVNFVSEIYRKNNVIPCIKHYPGHGDADKDSHLTLPQINLSLEEFEKKHIRAFRVKADMIMIAHLHCTCFDKEMIPTSLSKNAMRYLRKNIGYQGVTITDDMFMKGVEKYGWTEACLKAIEADVDMFIFREATKEVIESIDNLATIIENDENLKNKVINSDKRIETLKNKYIIDCYDDKA